MKIRLGFVSNSSTSSFHVFGIAVEKFETLIEAFFKDKNIITKHSKPNCDHIFDREKCQFCPTCGKPSWATWTTSKYDEQNIAQECKKKGWNYISEAYDGDFNDPGEFLGAVIGLNLAGKGGKRAALKHRVKELEDTEKELKNLFGDNIHTDFLHGTYGS